MWLADNMQNKAFETYAVIDANIVGTTMEEALSAVARMARSGESGYACFVNGHVSVMTRQHSELKDAVNSSTFAFPDGMPVYLVGRYLWGRKIHKISGPDFMQKVFEDEKLRRLNHYFYGGQEKVLEALLEKLKLIYPGCNIVGAEPPPFRPLTEEEQRQALDRINAAGAQIVWVGLGAPKQELWMQRNTRLLPGSVLLGVGAAFDFHAGSIKRAPIFMQKIGLEWLYRLMQDPGRLWRRYLVTNSLFIYYTFIDTIRRWSVKSPRS